MSTGSTGAAEASRAADGRERRAWRHVLTARDHAAAAAGGLAEQAPLPPPASPSPTAGTLPRVFVDPGRRFQTLMGFGGAFTEAAAVTWLRLPTEQREALLRAYFHPQDGHGYTLCRVHMNSCDFSLGNYAHAAVPGDLALEHFSIARDRDALLPFIQAAQRMAGRPLQLLASPWSPPAWMKTNGEMNHGGRLRPECRDAWAQCYVRFIQAYAAEGVPIWGVSVQNEPAALQRWDSCLYSAEEERDFVRDHLGPALAAAGLGEVRIVVWDHNRDWMVERAAVVYNDPEASRYVWGTGFHWYGEDHFDHVQLLHDAWPDKQLLFTEGCQEGGPHTGEWAVGERYGRSILQDLNHWTVGWIDWNLLLDETGGPNHVGNLCSAPMLTGPLSLPVTGQPGGDPAGTLHPQSAFHVLGHFSRFMQPGAQRVLCAATREALECTAARNPDGSVAVVVMNRTEQPLPFELQVAGDARVTAIPARAIATWVVPAWGPALGPA